MVEHLVQLKISEPRWADALAHVRYNRRGNKIFVEKDRKTRTVETVGPHKKAIQIKHEMPNTVKSLEKGVISNFLQKI